MCSSDLAFMWGIAGSLNDDQIDALAEYYSAKTPRSHSYGDASARYRGKSIYEKGLPAQGVPACVTCHGANGEGVAAFPRLAGQQAPYFVSQMRAFRTNLRVADIMQPVARYLTSEDIDALAAYVRSR